MEQMEESVTKHYIDKAAYCEKVFTEAGINLQNSKPDSGPRRWFAGPFSPTIRGIGQLQLVAWYVATALENERKKHDQG